MPRYSRRRYSRRRYRRSVPRYSRMVTGRVPLTRGERLLSAGAPYAAAIPAIARTVGTIASMINTEAKFNDQTQTNQSIDNSTGFVSSMLTGMARGTGDNERIGNRILGKAIFIRGTLAINTSNTGSQLVRLMLIVDKEYDGTAPSLSNVLQTTSPLSPLDEDYSKRYVVLRTATYALSSQRPNITFKWHKRTPWHLDYDGASSTAADGKENQMFLLAISDQATNVPTITYYSRFKYYDT